MDLVGQFNALNGIEVNRKTLEKLLELAEKQRHTHIQKRIIKVLGQYKDDRFKIELANLVEPYGLNGEQHIGIEKIALNNCGRLNAGYKYLKGGEIVETKTKKTTPRRKKNAQTPKKPTNKVTKSIIEIEKVAPRVTKNVQKTSVKIKKIPERGITITHKESNKNAKNVIEVPTKNINIDTKRFQNRDKLNKTVLNNIVSNYSKTKLDPVILWKDKTGKIFLLAGHHRLEATKIVGETHIEAKFFIGTEAEAIHYAKVESNANRSLETPIERAKIYREIPNKKERVEKAKSIEGKNASYILNLSYLNPKGVVINALSSFEETTDKQNATIIEKIADWIGEARKTNEKLTNAHEKEMFDFLQDKTQSERINTKAEFLQKIHAIVGGFDFNENSVLNLKRFKYKSEGESVYDVEYQELKTKIDKLIENRLELKDRISNPKNPNYINSNAKDYNVVLSVFDKQTQKYTEELKDLQQKLIELQKNKGSYTNAGSNQVGLFGVKAFKKIKLSAYTIASNCTDLTDANDGFNEVYDAIEYYKKNHKKIPNFFYLRSSKLVDKIKYFEENGLKGTAQNKETIAFNKQILLAKRNGYKNETKFNLGISKDILENIIGKHNITLTGSVINKAMKKDKAHCLRWEHLINLPDNINNPLAIFKSIKSGYVILTEIKDELNKPLIVAIHFKKGFNVQDIRSIYSKTNDSTYKNWKKDGLLLYENKKSKSFARILGLIPSSANKMLSSNKDIQNNQNNQKKDKIILTKNTKVKNISQNSTVKSSYYKVAGDEGRFLQAVEKKPVHSVVITFDGEQGAGKTTTLYKFMNSFAQENKCLFISAEEHQDSYLAKDKTENYLNTTAQKNIDIISDLENEKEFYNLINPYEIIFIDSWQKLQRMIGNIRLDEDLRKKFNGKVFVIIFQQTTTGRTKGGAEIVFDGDIIVKMNKGKTFSENYAYFDKNRYTKVPIETLKYNIEKGKLISTEPIENKTNFSFKIN